MSKTKRLFVVSDIHGHYTLLKKALDDEGFDENNEDHLFICCGDLFDRGTENIAVYDFVRRLKHKVLIRGNHDERLLEILSEKQANVTDVRNGVYVTVEEFFGIGSFGEYGEIRLPKDETISNKLCELIRGMLDYYETEHYVFVHGWIPTVPGSKPPMLLKNWRNADAKAWHSSRFLEWMTFYHSDAKLANKTIVCGHRPTWFGYTVDTSRSPANYAPVYGKGMIAIDGGTIRSGIVNVLVLEEDLLS